MKLSEAQSEIRAAIRFYDRRGWNWLSIVEFLSRKANGTLRIVPEGYVLYKRKGRNRVTDN